MVRRVDIGIDLGGSKMALAMVEPEGEVVYQTTRPVRALAGPDTMIEDLIRFVGENLHEAGCTTGRLGIGVCGQVARGSGVVRLAPNLPGWSDVPLRQRLEDALRVPVAVANDLHTIALGESEYGAGRGAVDLVVVFVGTGIGGALISEGRLVLGHAGHAGEIGHTTVVMDGRACSCGNQGCVEAYAAGWAIGERAREAVAEAEVDGGSLLSRLVGRDAEITAKTVADAYRRGDPLASRLVEETARYLGAAMANAVNSFNPGRLILGGGVIDGVPELVEMVRVHVARSALSACADGLEIVPPELGGYAGAVGAVVLARQRYPEMNSYEDGSR